MQQLMQHKAEVAVGVLATSGTLTWIDQANAWVDLGVGIGAIFTAVFACVWYYQKIRSNQRDKDGD